MKSKFQKIAKTLSVNVFVGIKKIFFKNKDLDEDIDHPRVVNPNE